MKMVRLLSGLVLLLPWLAAQVPPVEAAPTVLQRAQRLLDKGQHDAAIEVLRGAIPESSAAEAERCFLARILAWLGRTDEALAVLQQGLGRGLAADDASLQWEIGRIHRRLGDDGPFFRREGEMVAYLPHDDTIDEAAWRRDHWQKALDAYLVVLAANPKHRRTHELVGGLQTKLGQHEAALATWSKAAELFPDSSKAQLGCARALAALGRAAEAAAACERALRITPRLAEAHALLADHLAAAGDPQRAQQERQQAVFYEWAPEFLELDFATADATFRLLAPQLPDEPTDEQRQQARQARDAEIQRLRSVRSPESTRLLAAVCYFHEDHGTVEQDLFVELQARGEAAIPVLLRLLENAQTTCTQKGAAHALASLRAPGLLPILVEMLPGDVRPMWEADIAGALATLGDRAAVAPLLELADLGKAGDDEGQAEDFMLAMGREAARRRAVLAVGTLGGDEAQRALAAGVGHTRLGTCCRVALYRITRDAAAVAPVRDLVKAADSLERHLLVAYLAQFAPELAAELRDEPDTDESASEKSGTK
ncbi:MAG: tetratricopeptide repeat protein [Planctomycetes bacterium]|nr:tetratricopeptide repeat protein [Planctomycetota bacterium]